MDDFQQYNPDIVAKDLRWSPSKSKDLERKIHISMGKLWFSQSHIPGIIASTKENLFYGLTPQYSPLYKYGQIHLWYTIPFSDPGEWEILKWICEYLREEFCDKSGIRGIINHATLLSQFSWIMVKRILHSWVKWNEYILWKLFRYKWGWKIKEYSQLEAIIPDWNIKEIVRKMELFLNGVFQKTYNCVSISEKSFPFVFPGFEFTFQNTHGHVIKIVWWYVDQRLLIKFPTSRDYFIFWINTTKLDALQLVEWKERIRRGVWGQIPLMSIPEWDIFSTTSDIQKIGEAITITPNKLPFLLKDRLKQLLYDSWWMKVEYPGVSGEWDVLTISWDWREYFFSSLPDYLRHYYWWVVLSESEKGITMKFTGVDTENLWKLLWWEWRKKEIYIPQEDITQQLWFSFDLMSLEKELQALWYEIKKVDQGYILMVPIYKWNIKGFRHIVWEVIYHVFRSSLGSYSPTWNNVAAKTDSQDDDTHKKILFSIPQFLLDNGFMELDQSCLGHYSCYPDINEIFWKKEYTLGESNLFLKRSLIDGVIQHRISHRSPLPCRWFSIENLADGFHIFFFLQCRITEDNFNLLCDFLHTISNILWKSFRLNVKNDLQSMEVWKSFLVIDANEKAVWYLWKLHQKKNVDGNMYIAEFVIKI